MELSGKTVLVTGAAKRVGRHIALAFAAKKCRILLHYRSSEADAEKTARAVRALGVECVPVQADLAETASVRRMVESLPHPVDILVNSASLFYKTPFREANEDDFDRLVNANLKGPFTLSRLLGLRMGAGGKIINIADWSGLRPYKDYAPYCLSKGGLITFTKSLARELAPRVLANAIAPGPVMMPEDFSDTEKEAVAKQTVLGRWGSPNDVAQAAVFLAESDFINGTVLVVDGGRSII